MQATTRRRNAFSLIELLCVAAIIGVLASLILSAVFRAYGRAKRMQREFDGPTHFEHLREQLALFTQAQPNYPALTAPQLRELGAFDDRTMSFLRWRDVSFHPFSSTNGEDFVILQARFSRSSFYVLTKKSLAPPEER